MYYNNYIHVYLQILMHGSCILKCKVHINVYDGLALSGIQALMNKVSPAAVQVEVEGPGQLLGLQVPLVSLQPLLHQATPFQEVTPRKAAATLATVLCHAALMDSLAVVQRSP